MTIVNCREDSDSRDLIFATQTLVKRTEVVGSDSKIKESLKGHPIKKGVRTKWVSRTHLGKVRLSKDILKVKM